MITLQANDSLILTQATGNEFHIVAEFADGSVFQRACAGASEYVVAKGGQQLTRLTIVAVGGADTVTFYKSVQGVRRFQVTSPFFLNDANGWITWDAANGWQAHSTSDARHLSLTV
jgi:hypothetical protein